MRPASPGDRVEFAAPAFRGKPAGSLYRDREPQGRSRRELDLLLYRPAIEIVAVDQDQAEIARIAWRRFGKGRHAAGLNYRDCFAYALASSRRLPLLFQGDDFSRTDIDGVPLLPAGAVTSSAS
jgi:uncharacterized protein with PIN domain